MTMIQIVAKMPYKGGLPRDVTENSWWFNVNTGIAAPSPEDQALGAAEALRDQFYNFTTTAGAGSYHGISDVMANYVNRDTDAATMRMYLVDETTFPAPGSSTHIGDLAWTLGPPGVADEGALPAEVALVLTTFTTDRSLPSRSWHGRIYLGPFVNALETEETSPLALYSRPQPWLMAILLEAGNNFWGWTTSTTGERPRWVIFSRKHKVGVPVDGGACDDEWDTQRRRGADRTTRTIQLFS